MVPLTPFSDRGSLWNLMREFDDLFARLRTDWGGLADMPRSLSPLEMEETDQAYVFSIDLPGVRKEDVKVDIQQNTLSITAERKGSKSEKRYGTFQQMLTLPPDVDIEKLEAHHDNGLLEIVMPKSQQHQSRSIEIKSGRHSQIESSSRESTEANPNDLSKQAPIQDSPSATHH